MNSNFSRILPFLVITLLCVGAVEGFCLILEHSVFKIEKKQPAVAKLTEKKDDSLPKKVSSTPTPKVNYTVIIERNLFGPPPGKQNKNGVEEKIDVEGLGTTKLEIVLMGTIEGGDEGSRAIILTKKDKNQEIYQTGDYIQEALVKDILRGKVILNYNGKDEVLDMTEAANYTPKIPQKPIAVSPSVQKRTISSSKPRRIISNNPSGQQGMGVVKPVRNVRKINSNEPNVITE